MPNSEPYCFAIRRSRKKRKGETPLRELALSSDIQKIRIGIQITTT